MKVSVLTSITESGATSPYMQRKLADSDVSLVLHPLSSSCATSRTAPNVYGVIMRDGMQAAVVDTTQTRVEPYKHLSYHDFEQKLDRLFQK